MTRKLILSAIMAGCIAFGAGAQIVVTSVKSSGTRASSDRSNITVFRPGGDTSADYTTVADGAYECLYSWHIHTVDKNGVPADEDYICMLQFGPGAARFTDYLNFRADSAIMAATPDLELRRSALTALGDAEFSFTGDVIQGYPEGKLTYTDLVTPDYLEYTEPLGSLEWQLTDRTDTICGYLCTMATAEYGGRSWNAWFAEEIPSAFGPWKFNGLPGLILRVTDSEGVHDFKAISLRQGEVPLVKPHNRMLRTTDRATFIDSKARFEKSPYKYLAPEAIRNMAVLSGGVVVINDVAMPKRPNPYTPVELK